MKDIGNRFTREGWIQQTCKLRPSAEQSRLASPTSSLMASRIFFSVVLSGNFASNIVGYEMTS